MRVRRFEEYLQVLKGMWTEPEPFSFEGSFEHVSVRSRPRPLQRPHPPLLVGVAQPRMIRLAAREADIVSFGIFASAGEADDKLAILRDAGKRFDELEIRNGAQLIITDEEPRAVAERALHSLPGGPSSNPTPATIDDYFSAPGTFIGSHGGDRGAHVCGARAVGYLLFHNFRGERRGGRTTRPRLTGK